MGLLGRYLSGLCVAVLGLCGAGWLVLTPLAFGYRGPGLREAALTDRATGTGLAVISVLTLAAWTLAWRRKLRADGVLARTSRWQARRQARGLRRREPAGNSDPAGSTPDPAQVLSELRALLHPLLADPAPAAAPAAAGTPVEIHHHGGIPGPRSEQDPFELPGGCQPGLADLADFGPAPGASQAGPPAPAPAPSGLAAIESMLAGAELLMTGVGEEEAW